MHRGDTYMLNHATVCLARRNIDERHNFGFGHYELGDARGKIREAWRFPVIDTCTVTPAGEAASDFNDVTFIYMAEDTAPAQVGVIGTFGLLYEPVALRRVKFLDEDTSYWALTLALPRREVYYYKFVVDGAVILDPVNPQRSVLENGVEWSRFFTWECSVPIVLESWELAVLQRLCNHLLPFRTRAGQRFLSWYYEGLDQQSKQGEQRSAYRLDDSAGAAFYIDHILAREENHHLNSYRMCLKQVHRILRERAGLQEPEQISMEFYRQIYNELASGNVPGWDYGQYDNPGHFLDLLRRHAFTGAFSHPKYGGNAGGVGWSYLNQEVAPFDWRRSIEAPLGTSVSYVG